MNFTQSVLYLRRNVLFYVLSILTICFSMWWWLDPLKGSLAIMFSTLLVGLALVDAKYFLLPNALVGTLAVFGLFHVIAESQGLPTGVEPGLFIAARILTALVATIFMLGMSWFAKLFTRREAMGMGDIKMIAAVTLWVDLDGLLLTMLFASLLALPWALYSVVRRILKKHPVAAAIPFGPFLAIGAWLAFTFRDAIAARFLAGM